MRSESLLAQVERLDGVFRCLPSATLVVCVRREALQIEAKRTQQPTNVCDTQTMS